MDRDLIRLVDQERIRVDDMLRTIKVPPAAGFKQHIKYV